MKKLYYFCKYLRYNLSTIIKSLITVTLCIFLMSYCVSLFNEVNVYKSFYSDELSNSLLLYRSISSAPSRTMREYTENENFKNIGFIRTNLVKDNRNPNSRIEATLLSDNMAEALNISLSAGDGFNLSSGRTEVIVSYDLLKAYDLYQTYYFVIDDQEISAVVVGYSDKSNILPTVAGQGYQYLFGNDKDMVFAGGDLFDEEVLDENINGIAIVFGTTDVDYYNSLDLYDSYTKTADSYQDYIDLMENDIYTYAFLTSIVLAIVLFGVGASEMLGYDAKRKAYAVRYLCGETPSSLFTVRLIASAGVLTVASILNLLVFVGGGLGNSTTFGNIFGAIAITAAVYALSLIPSIALQIKTQKVDELRGTL